MKLEDLPTEFRGCCWDDGWDFGCPCVVYYPKKYKAFRDGNNTGGIESLIEDITIDIECENPHDDGGLKEECEWRGWDINGFHKRKRAEHIKVSITWEEGYFEYPDKKTFRARDWKVEPIK